VNTVATNSSRIIYWHRELPPFDADAVAEHVIEATSSRVPGTLVHRDELWGQCYETLMASAATRLEQEVARLGGHYAHVLDESIDSRHDGATGEAWLHGRFTYMLYRRPVKTFQSHSCDELTNCRTESRGELGVTSFRPGGDGLCVTSRAPRV
jgi:hypothetical protein